MLLQSCSQYREIHSHVHSLHKNHTQKKKSTANWDQIPSPTRKQGTTTGFISHFAKKKTNPDELYSETWKPPAWKAAKPCLSSVTPCGVARPSPCILSSSEMQQFSAKTGKKMKKSTCTSPHARPESWLSRDWLSEQLERKMGGKKKGQVCRKIPSWPVQPHWLSHIDCPAAPFLQHLQAACARAKGHPAAPVFQRHSGKTDLKAGMAVAFPQATENIEYNEWLFQPPAHTRRHTTERQLQTVPCQHFYHNTYIFICRRYNFQPENNPILTHSQHRSILLHLSWRG